MNSSYANLDLSVHDDHYRMEALRIRLRLPPGELLFRHLSTAVLGDDVLVWVVTAEKQVVLQDGIGMFPSDALITQLKLLAGK